MPERRLLLLLCVMMGAYTFCVSSFPVLIPEVGAAFTLADWQLGIMAGAFGFARMLTDIPAGLLMAHHVRRAMIGAPVFMLVGAVLVGTGGGFAAVLLGQVSLSIGYTLANLGSVTIILRQRAERGLASALNAYELSAMIAVLAAVATIGLLPRGLPWNVAYLIGCVPIVIGLAALRSVLPRLPPTDPAQPWFTRMAARPSAAADHGGATTTVVLAVAAGGLVALTYTTVASFLVPLRGSREFGLQRAGIAQLLMLAQTCDIAALLPVGALADRRGPRAVLAIVLVTIGAAIGLIAFGGLPQVVTGCVLFGVGMAGWMLPLGLLRSATPAALIAWRTALYRVSVDGGMFLGPFLSGVLARSYPTVVPVTVMLALAVLAVALWSRRTAPVAAPG
jgi:MFS family permease